MGFTAWENIVFTIVLLGFASETAWYAYKKCTGNDKKRKKSSEKPITDVLFFSEQSSQCRTHANSAEPCHLETCPIKNLNKLMAYLSSATKTLDICVYFLTYNAVVKLLKELYKKDVVIRIITDDESTENDASQIFFMRKAGMKVRTKKSLYLMHHKFAIIDRKLLITGSANWTIQAYFGNCENILITNQARLVKSFLLEYERLWAKYDIDYSTESQMIEKMRIEAEEKKRRERRDREFGI